MPTVDLRAFAAFVAITRFWRSDWSALRTRRWAFAPLALLPGVVPCAPRKTAGLV